jgi:hypothetical protein
MKSPSIHLCVFAGIIAGGSLAQAQAAEIKVGGTVTYAYTSAEESKLPDGSTIGRVHAKGVIVDKDPKSPLNLNAQDCDGFGVITADGKGPPPGAGSCDAVDKDGDRWAMWWVEKDGNRWGVTYGTGKFAGMTGGGTTKAILDLPDRQTITFEGTLTMK